MSIWIRNQDSMGYCKLVTGFVGGAGLAVAYQIGAIGPALTAIGAIGCLWAIASSRNTSGERDLINNRTVSNNCEQIAAQAPSLTAIPPALEKTDDSFTHSLPEAPGEGIVDPSAIDYAIGFHYVVKREGNIIADIIGTCHGDEVKNTRLNPTIEQAVKRANKVALEAPFCINERAALSKVATMWDNYNKEYLDFHQKNFDENKIIIYPELKEMSRKEFRASASKKQHFSSPYLPTLLTVE